MIDSQGTGQINQMMDGTDIQPAPIPRFHFTYENHDYHSKITSREEVKISINSWNFRGASCGQTS